jgi:predicted nucleotidyltransferase
MRVIRRDTRQIAERFQPEKIILFGSFAYGTPHQWSDVDLLVVMPCANHFNQAVRIRRTLDAPFLMDLLVRTPEKLRKRIEDGNQFLREIGGLDRPADDAKRCPSDGETASRRRRTSQLYMLLQV